MLRHEKEMDNTNIVNKNLQSKKKIFFSDVQKYAVIKQDTGTEDPLKYHATLILNTFRNELVMKVLWIELYVRRRLRRCL